MYERNHYFENLIAYITVPNFDVKRCVTAVRERKRERESIVHVTHYVCKVVTYFRIIINLTKAFNSYFLRLVKALYLLVPYEDVHTAPCVFDYSVPESVLGSPVKKFKWLKNFIPVNIIITLNYLFERASCTYTKTHKSLFVSKSCIFTIWC